MSGFTEAQGNLPNEGVWSWVSRDPIGINKMDGVVEEMTVTPAYCQYGGDCTLGPGMRDNGATYLGQWQQVYEQLPPVVLICQVLIGSNLLKDNSMSVTFTTFILPAHV